MSTTYGACLDRIADETRYTDSDSRAIIKLCVQDAIAYYEKETFWWNQSRTTTFNTVVSQEYYSSSDNASIPYILDFDALTITINSGNAYNLFKQEWQILEYWNADAISVGQPSDYAYYSQMIRLYPIPNGVWPIRIAGIFKLTTLVNDSDTNAWVTTGEGEELIRNHAKGIFYSQYLRDDANAQRALQMAQAAYLNLRTSTQRRIGTSTVRMYL